MELDELTIRDRINEWNRTRANLKLTLYEVSDLTSAIINGDN